jgi:transforming growth factor-beta-induced protein
MSIRTKFILIFCLMLWAVVPAFAQRDTTADGLIDVLKDTRGLSTFSDLIDFLGLEERYNNADVFYTVFALEDDTAEALLTDLGFSMDTLDDMSDTDRLTLSVIITYHFLPGAYSEATFTSIQDTMGGDEIQLASALTGTVLTYDNGRVDDIAEVTDSDIAAGNGYIHIIDNYLVPTKDAFERSVDVITSDSDLTEDQASKATIAENLQGADEFSMIAEALDKVGLMDDLEDKGQYTIFVMSDDSLNSALDNANMDWDDFLDDEEGLTRLLMYHILPGQYTSTALQELDGAFVGTMLAHTVVGFGVSRGDLSINQVPVVASDVIASNGIIHVIDGVLLPPAAGND